MNILLDTNSFRYLYEIEKNKEVPIKIDHKIFNSKKFLDFCSQCKNIYIPSETLFELMFQNVKKDNNISEFCDQYQFINEFKRKYNLNFKIMNSISDIEFDNEYLVKCVNSNIPINFSKYINIRIDSEIKIMLTFLRIIHTTVKDVVLEVTGDTVFTEDFEDHLNLIYKTMETDIRLIYNKYYISYSITITEFENEIDNLLGSIIYLTCDKINQYTNQINPKLSISNELKSEYVIESEGEINIQGAKFVQDLYKRLGKRCNTHKQFSKELEDCIKLLIAENKMSMTETNFIKFIAEKFISGRKIRKNDVLDYSLVTSLNEKSIVMNFDSKVNKENIYLITFDKTLRSFSEKYNCLYNESIYNCFLE